MNIPKTVGLLLLALSLSSSGCGPSYLSEDDVLLEEEAQAADQDVSDVGDDGEKDDQGGGKAGDE